MKKILISATFSLFIALAAPAPMPAQAIQLQGPGCLQPAKLLEFSDRWQAQDIKKTSLRAQVDLKKTTGFEALETVLSDAPARHQAALANFKLTLETAAHERRESVDLATEKFRTGVRNCAEVGDIDRLIVEYRVSVHAATEAFRAAVRQAQADFKTALAR